MRSWHDERSRAGSERDGEAKFCTTLTAELVSSQVSYWLSDKIPAEFMAKRRLRLADNALTVRQPLN